MFSMCVPNRKFFINQPNTYSASLRSLCVRPGASCVWTIFPPTRRTHAYLTSVHHRALASASMRVHPWVCIRAPACLSVRPSAYPSVCLHVPSCVCRSGRAPCVCGSSTNSSSCRKTAVCRSCNRESQVFSGTCSFVCPIR